MQYQYRLTEEVARWAFEVHVEQLTVWTTVFVNPTAGPWKRLMGRDAGDVAGEVHRFEREERRPDLVIVSDRLEMVAIIEAKDSLAQLATPAQISKSAAIVADLTRLLRTKADNPFWARRSTYVSIAGLLWAVDGAAGTSAARQAVLSAYVEALDFSTEGITEHILGIECYRGVEGVRCRGFISSVEPIANGVKVDDLLASLSLSAEQF